MKMMRMLLISALLASGVAFGTSPRGRARSACACSDPNPCQHDNDGSCLSTIECPACCGLATGCAPGVNCVGYVVGGSTSQDTCCTAGTTHCGPAYTLMNEKLSWSDANAACLAAGLQLATVQSAEQNALLLTVVGDNEVWIGGTDAASEGAWVWSPSNASLSYTNWGFGQPNDYNNGEDCLMFNWRRGRSRPPYTAGQWTDMPCASHAKYVCQTACPVPQIGRASCRERV